MMKRESLWQIGGGIGEGLPFGGTILFLQVGRGVVTAPSHLETDLRACELRPHMQAGYDGPATRCAWLWVPVAFLGVTLLWMFMPATWGLADKANVCVAICCDRGGERECPQSRVCLSFVKTELRVSSRRSSELSFWEVKWILQNRREGKLSAGEISVVNVLTALIFVV